MEHHEGNRKERLLGVPRHRLRGTTLLIQLGVAGSWSFVHRNSKYIGKFFTLLTTWLGWKVALKANEHYNYSKRVTNFHLYPKEIQRALDNNDFRYARQWLNEPIKEEPVPVKDTLPEVAAEQDDE